MVTVPEQQINLTFAGEVDVAQLIAIMESCWVAITALGLAEATTVSLSLNPPTRHLMAVGSDEVKAVPDPIEKSPSERESGATSFGHQITIGCCSSRVR
jgi:hypothetical protein